MNLFINTTTKYVSIIVFDEQQIIEKFEYIGNNDHTLTIYKYLDRIDLNNISAIYVPRGPGSYTGVRIGMLVAKTLAYELGAKLFTINTLQLFYFATSMHVVMDARSNKYFKYDGNEYSQIMYDEQTDEYIIDDYFNSNKLLDKNVLTKFTISDPLTVSIEYLKDAI